MIKLPPLVIGPSVANKRNCRRRMFSISCKPAKWIQNRWRLVFKEKSTRNISQKKIVSSYYTKQGEIVIFGEMLVNVYLLLPLTRGRCKVHRKHLRRIRDGAYLYYLNAVIYSIVVIFHPPFSCEFPPLRCYVYVPVVIPLSYAILLVSRKGVAVRMLCIIWQGFRISFVKTMKQQQTFC